MGYRLVAVVGRAAVLRGESLAGRAAVRLTDDLCLIPLIGPWKEPGEMFHPPAEIVPRLVELSHRGAIAFLEGNNWGGPGMQACIVWRAGDIILGRIEAHDAINQALALLGVTTSPGCDEFDVVDLGRHRRTEEWLEEPAV